MDPTAAGDDAGGGARQRERPDYGSGAGTPPPRLPTTMAMPSATARTVAIAAGTGDSGTKSGMVRSTLVLATTGRSSATLDARLCGYRRHDYGHRHPSARCPRRQLGPGRRRLFSPVASSMRTSLAQTSRPRPRSAPFAPTATVTVAIDGSWGEAVVAASILRSGADHPATNGTAPPRSDSLAIYGRMWVPAMERPPRSHTARRPARPWLTEGAGCDRHARTERVRAVAATAISSRSSVPSVVLYHLRFLQNIFAHLVALRWLIGCLLRPTHARGLSTGCASRARQRPRRRTYFHPMREPQAVQKISATVCSPVISIRSSFAPAR